MSSEKLHCYNLWDDNKTSESAVSKLLKHWLSDHTGAWNETFYLEIQGFKIKQNIFKNYDGTACEITI